MLDLHATPLDVLCYRLRAGGSSIGDTATAAGWIVAGFNGENRLLAHGLTQREAWERAAQEAERLGMFCRSFY